MITWQQAERMEKLLPLASVRQWLSLASTLAWLDTRLRYRRTKLGPFWVTFSTGAMVLAVGLVYGKIFAAPGGLGSYGYMPFFATGFILWNFISASILEGCTVFITNGSLIKALQVPLVVHVFRMIGRNLILFGHNFLIILLLWLFIGWPVSWSSLLIFPALAILTLAVLGGVMTLAIICTRFRDIQQLIQSLLQLMFLITPIIWPPTALPATAAHVLLYFNPLFYLLEVVRAPLLGEPTGWLLWLGASGVSLTALGLGIALYRSFKHRIPYWL